MKKIFKLFGIVVLIFCFSTSLSAQIQRPGNPFKIEVGISFGSTLGYSTTESAYSDSWSTYWISISESGEITPKLSTPMSFGGNISLITNTGIGVQLALDYNFNSDFAGVSTYTAKGYDWWGPINESQEFDNSGTVKMMVLSLNFIYKYQGDMFSPWFAAGASYYTGNIEANSKVGFGYEDWAGDFEYISPDVKIKEDLSGIGFNVGGGVDIQIAPTIAVTLEAKYFILKKYELNWETQTGQYVNYIWGGTVTLTQTGADYMDELIEPFEFNASFPKIAAGIKFSF